MSDTGLDFELGEMADTIRETTERFARDKIAPIAAEIDESDEFPRASVAADGRARACTASPSRRSMAGSASAISSMSSRRRKSRAASASVGLSYGAHSNLCVNQIRRWANDGAEAQISARS